jgi:signal transduction histidine kinase/CheY-like chemotaxis protein
VADYDDEVRRTARALSDIAHCLEGSDDADVRVARALERTRTLVPFARCALLKAPDELHALPRPADVERAALVTRLRELYRLVIGADEIGRSSDMPAHLTLPLMGLDEVFGVIRVEPPPGLDYDARHLRLFSVVAAQLGAYFALLAFREREAARAAELQAALEYQQLLVGVVSHDLRTPLQVIITVAQLLLMETQEPKKVKAYERSLRNAQRASRIINDLLDVTHARVSGGIAARKRPMDLRAVVSEAVDDAAVRNPDRLIALVDDGAGAWTGDGDPDRLTQVMTNLIGNALQHGSRDRPITVTLRRGDGRAIIGVENHGAPIPAERLPSLFDPFKGGVGERAVGDGLGLGLYIVDRIAAAHGGAVTARSTADGLTTFEVSLPWAAPAEAADDDAPAVAGPGVVLVVDDDPDVRGGIVALLEDCGFDVASAANGDLALSLLRAGLRPGLVLLDLNMPVMRGEAFFEVCQADPALADIPIVIISAEAAEAVKLAQHGASAVLPKPLRAADLVKTVEAVTRRTPAHPAR